MLNLVSKEILNTFEKGPIYRSLFSNGACYINHHAKGFSSAKVSLTYLAGSMFENEKEQGLAHLVEHLLFKEIKTQYVKDIEQNGGDLNAFTYKETVCFEMDCHYSDLKKLLPLFLEHFSKLDFSDEQFEKEKQVILHELKEDLDDHETQGIEEVFKKSFPFDVGHPVGGATKDIPNFTKDDVKRYFKKYFKSERLILTIVSGRKVNLDKLISNKLVERFGQRSKKPFRLKSGKKHKIAVFKKTQKKKMESSVSFLCFEGPKVKDPNYYSYIILDDLLFEGLSSRMFKKLREENPLVYGMGSSLSSFHHCGHYLMIFNGPSKNAKKVKESALEVLDCIKDGEFTEDEVIGAKRRLIKAWEMSFDDLDERAEFLSDQEIYGLIHKTLAEMRYDLEKVTRNSIQKLVKKVYKNDEFSYLLYRG